MFACQGRDGLRAVRLITRDRSPPERHRSGCRGRLGHCWAIPGVRPLRRRCEMVLISATDGYEGPWPSRAPPIMVAGGRWAIAGRFPGGRPLRRRRERVLISATDGYEGP